MPALLRRFVLLVLLALLTACGKKGPPRPPLPPIPAESPPLLARQVGDALEVLIPMPVRMVDGTPVTGFAGLRLERLVRDLDSQGRPRPVSRREFDGAEVALELTAEDPGSAPLPAPGEIYIHQEPLDRARFGADPAAVAYAARFRVRRRWSPPTPPVVLVPGSPPPPPASAAVQGESGGARLIWSAPPVEEQGTAVYRTRPGQPFPFAPLTVVPAGEGTFLDPTVVQEPGAHYVYELRTVRGEGIRRRLSAAAGPLEVDMTDRFAPAPPRGLTALARPGGVDLFWLPGDEIDLEGYRVHRREGADGPWLLLTPEGIATTAFSDTGVEAGAVYVYAVSAFDGAKPPNESARSATQEIRVPRPAPPEEETP